MVQNIGLMITCNEEDCIEEVMNEHIKYLDKILVLDGSSDRTEEILRRYPQVVYLLKDREIIDQLPNREFEDGARQFLLAKAQELFPVTGWFTLLHGDEIFYHDPNWVIEQAEKVKAEKVNWYAMNFFLHTSQRKEDPKQFHSIQERIRWYCPGRVEIRQFRNKPGISYDLGQKYNVLPRGIGLKIYKYFPIVKHYFLRSVEQVLAKKRQNQATGFSSTYDIFQAEASCFMDILPGYKVARKFDGSFHEFEIEQQGSLFNRWLRAHKYIPAKIGPFTI